MGEKHKKARRDLNQLENFHVSVFVVSGCISISSFASIVGATVGTESSAVGLKICATTARIKKV